MSRSVLRLSLLPMLAGLLLAAGPVSSDDAAVATAQLPVARQLARQAKAIVAVADPTITPADPAKSATRTQNFIVHGIVAECFKGPVRPSSFIGYTITAEGRPAKLAQKIR